MTYTDITPEEWTRNEQIKIETTSTKVCDKRIDEIGRQSFVIRNTSTDLTEIITLAIGNTPAVALAGIVLKAGELYAENNDAGFKCWQGTIFAISNKAGGVNNLSVFER